MYVAYRQLNMEITPEGVARMQKAMSQLLLRNFETNSCELLDAGCDVMCCNCDPCFLTNSQEELSTLFCTEFIAECLQALGAVPEASTRRSG